MQIWKSLVGAAMAAGVLLSASCAPTATTTQAAQRVPVAQRSKLVNRATSAQEARMRSYAAEKFGGFDSWFVLRKVYVSGAVLIGVNGQPGPNNYYHPLGTYNATWDGKLSIASESGRLKILTKFDHYQIYGNNLDAYEFQAIPGHEYFLGHVWENIPGKFRWVPVIYDKTTDSIVPIPNAKPKTAPQPQTITLYV